MDKLTFVGEIIKGRGRHKELWIPGRADLVGAPADWPEQLHAGSVNVLIASNGYPQEFKARCIPLTVQSLDLAEFQPGFTIPQDQMQNNTLSAIPGAPNRGEAQVWRAHLLAGGNNIACWVLRRFGSGLMQELELVSGEGIRYAYKLPEEVRWPATVEVYGKWRA
jgi:hypothetical protein